ncbi:C40 family peptidase [Fusobacterium sp. PH5-44]|uniref:C40 family peptidase n=1 Tax=unclassified Fusobacterium TaxID=2648384 RepID=UPI003D1AE8F3
MIKNNMKIILFGLFLILPIISYSNHVQEDYSWLLDRSNPISLEEKIEEIDDDITLSLADRFVFRVDNNVVQVSNKRLKVVTYAMQFVGNPYRAGGTSLTSGADCSGFTMSVFKDCGISIPRTSRTQAQGGVEIPVKSIQPGDLLFYTRGKNINHVALYIGDGKVVHASTTKTGIKVSNYDYREPVKAVTFID